MSAGVADALIRMRPAFKPLEADLHEMVGERLTDGGYAFEHEARLGGGLRIDFLVGDVGVEIKKGKPGAKALAEQLRAYAKSDRIASLIVVSQRSVKVPDSVLGKPVTLITLNSLWGVSLP